MNPLRDSRWMKSAIAAAAIFSFVGYYFVESAIQKGEEYSGTVSEKSSKTKWGKWFKTSGQYRKFYLTIDADDAKVHKVRVSRTVYQTMKKGDRIIKKKGERYPRLENPGQRAIPLENFDKPSDVFGKKNPEYG